ncbi:Calmodulin-like protein 3 [Datura stramonium]|uniref:Calmodulin-like protein 3 n=1 Tax=Datura stramonium TaxID=4076 RepID=A0ABS8RNQ7_DATST|nr:Calmodulin-like protein 3 [Datura stramonium]
MAARRFAFDETNILALNRKAEHSTSRVEAVLAFVWEAVIVAMQRRNNNNAIKKPKWTSVGGIAPNLVVLMDTSYGKGIEWLGIMDSEELKRVFHMFDRNGDGRITKKELNDSLENMGIFMSDSDLAQMIKKIDVNGDGYIDIDEFGALYETIMEERDEEEDIREAFNVFDQNGDGFITVDELKSVLASLGLKQGRTIDDCKQMIKKVDVDGDGMVNFTEFKQMMKRGGFAALT